MKPRHASIATSILTLSVVAGLVSILGCAPTPEAAGLLDSLTDALNPAQSQSPDDNGGLRLDGTSDDPAGHDLTDDNGGARPDGVSDDPATDDSAAAPDDSGVSGAADNAGGQDLRLETRLTGVGAPSGNADYREESGRRKFKVEVEDFAAGTYDVTVNGTVVAQIAVGPLGLAEIEFDSKPEPGHVPFPPAFPAHLAPGDDIGVGGIVTGRL